jgi:Ca-activated chloride channel family protein
MHVTVIAIGTYHVASMIRTCVLAIATVLASTYAGAASLNVSNDAGNVSIVVTARTQLMVSGRTPSGASEREDLRIVQDGDDVRIDVLPRDTPLDLTISLPLGYGIDATTVAGDISVEGMVHSARLATKTGAVRLRAPLRGIRVSLDSSVAPQEFVNPDQSLFRTSDLPLPPGRPWRLRDRLSEDAISYGDYHISAEAPSAVELSEFAPPADWPLRFPWEATDELQEMVAPDQAAAASGSADQSESQTIDGAVRFSSRVRMVNLTVAVTDSKGRPVTGLTAEDFHILEDGREQNVEAVEDGDAAFNLALVLDMSGSSERHRAPLQAAARRFVEMARPGDRIAIYALTFGMFQVVSPLSSDREALLAAVVNLPGIVGASPLYDFITLAYAQELRQLPGERNALIVISDGLDNRMTDGSGPSTVEFGELEKMAQEMHAMIYPVLLLANPPGPSRSGNLGRPAGSRTSRVRPVHVKMSQRRMRILANATGGRLFPVKSIEDLDPVFPLIEAELRSVYSLGYYPENQDLDGAWRTIEIAVEDPDVSVRARPGYYAK